MAGRRKKTKTTDPATKNRKIRSKAWKKYTDNLRSLSDKASDQLKEYILAGHTEAETLEYAHALVTKYGEASSELACQMYEALAEYSGALVAAAEPAATATWSETARSVRGEMIRTSDAAAISSSAGRLVKLASVDTMMKNALRDGAEWAWIPSGDTCPYCLMLASRGWQHASEEIIENGHASHIHNNCDCTFAVRHSPDVDVEGYDPDALYDEYYGAGGTQWERINALRRKKYAENPEYYRAQKRAAYARRTASEKARLKSRYSNIVSEKALDAEGYKRKFSKITKNDEVNKTIYREAAEMLKRNSGTSHEDLVLIDARSGKVLHKLTESRKSLGVDYDDDIRRTIETAHSEGRPIIALHNHPNGLPPTLDDGSSALAHGYDYGVAVGHNLEVYTYTKADAAYTTAECAAIHDAISEAAAFSIDFEEDIWYNSLEEFGMKVRRLK